MKIFIGLGNFGEKYNGTRHNIGKDFLIWFANKNGFSDFDFDKYSECEVSYGILNGQEIEIVIPRTFMNISGEAISKFLKDKELGAKEIFVFHDDIDMNFGDVKIKEGESGSGGHNGIKSLFNHLKFKDFNRVKIGIIPKKIFGSYKKPSREKISSFVLAKFGQGERKQLEEIYKRAENLII